MKKTPLILLLLYCAFVFIECTTSYHALGPIRGVTGYFFKGNTNELYPKSRYKFNNLHNDYGLLIYSYEITGHMREKITVRNPDGVSGIRVYEHYFYGTANPTYTTIKEIDYFKERKDEFLGYRDSISYNDVILTFKKEKLVYGGRIFIDSDTERVQVKNRFEEDCQPFISKYADELENVVIDTTLIRLYKDDPQILTEDSVIYNPK